MMIAGYFSASVLFSRALRRFAALRLMTPFFAALSIAEIAARICSAVRSGAKRISFCSLRRCVLALRLWAARLSVCRARLSADVVLAIGDQELLSECCLARLLQALIRCEFRSLPGTGNRSSRPHLF